MSRSWVVVPMYNEATVVGDVIKGLLPHFPHIVCIDDGSTDGSPQVAIEAGAVVVRHPVNLGQGAALQTGFEYALQDPELHAVITFDADSQHRVQDATDMLARLTAGEADVVLGSRFLDDRTKISPLKRVVLRLVAWQSSASTGIELTDAHNGLRVINAATLRRIHLRQNRMAHASELIHQLAELKPTIVEHPVEIVYTEYSKSKGQSLLNGVNILADLFLR
ncbi:MULTISPECIES: glycosyltransferase family 2 protein [unclassified Arthrobacter]|uniref:glycosyltransferase family 2 protein n=2 Tax=unclassified Arthrobacter TaxID=235627 RepID=UPI001872B7A6|nr:MULTISPECIES: glycosyltransferase family 2 protein [unclassified Arthrobacter]